MELTLNFVKETKNCFAYAGEGITGNIYVPKSQFTFSGRPAAQIAVNIRPLFQDTGKQVESL